MALRGSAAVAGSGSCAAVRVCDRGVEGNGGLAKAMRDSDSGHAVYRCLLDSGVRPVARRGNGSVAGERTRDEEAAGHDDGRAGAPMAAAATHEWAAADVLFTHATD